MQNNLNFNSSNKESFLKINKDFFKDSSFDLKNYYFNFYVFLDSCEEESIKIQKYILENDQSTLNWKSKSKSIWEKSLNNIIDYRYSQKKEDNLVNIDGKNYYNPAFLYHVMTGLWANNSKGHFREISNIIKPMLKKEIEKLSIERIGKAKDFLYFINSFNTNAIVNNSINGNPQEASTRKRNINDFNKSCNQKKTRTFVEENNSEYENKIGYKNPKR